MPKRSLNLLPNYPIWVQATNDGRWSQSVVKSKAETPQSYVVQTPHGEYRRNRLQLKEVKIPATVPVSNCTSNTSTSSTVQPTNVSVYIMDGFTNPLCPIKELPDINKGNYNISGECAPDPQVLKWWKRTQINETRRSSRIQKANPPYIDASISCSHWCNKLTSYLKLSSTLNNADIIIV